MHRPARSLAQPSHKPSSGRKSHFSDSRLPIRNEKRSAFHKTCTPFTYRLQCQPLYCVSANERFPSSSLHLLYPLSRIGTLSEVVPSIPSLWPRRVPLSPGPILSNSQNAHGCILGCATPLANKRAPLFRNVCHVKERLPGFSRAALSTFIAARTVQPYAFLPYLRS